MADEVEIVEYDPRWPARFALESARIRSILAEPALEIEHHGSTAVPGLAALASAAGSDRHGYMTAKDDFIVRATDTAMRGEEEPTSPSASPRRLA